MAAKGKLPERKSTGRFSSLAEWRAAFLADDVRTEKVQDLRRDAGELATHLADETMDKVLGSRSNGPL